MPYSEYIKINKKNEDKIYICPGNPLLGNIFICQARNFCIPSKYGKELTLLIFKNNEKEPVFEIVFPNEFKAGNMFTMLVGGIDWSCYEYCLKMKGPFDSEKGLYFCENELLDPYANYVSGMDKWGKVSENLRSKFVETNSINDLVQKPNLKKEDLVIYEVHVRGFTENDKTLSSHGTYKGLENKIPYLVDLGINCVELLPIFEFNELQSNKINPKTRLLVGNSICYGYYYTLEGESIDADSLKKKCRK